MILVNICFRSQRDTIARPTDCTSRNLLRVLGPSHAILGPCAYCHTFGVCTKLISQVSSIRCMVDSRENWREFHRLWLVGGTLPGFGAWNAIDNKGDTIPAFRSSLRCCRTVCDDGTFRCSGIPCGPGFPAIPAFQVVTLGFLSGIKNLPELFGLRIAFADDILRLGTSGREFKTN
jgi:hypothetical protein